MGDHSPPEPLTEDDLLNQFDGNGVPRSGDLMRDTTYALFLASLDIRDALMGAIEPAAMRANHARAFLLTCPPDEFTHWNRRATERRRNREADARIAAGQALIGGDAA